MRNETDNSKFKRFLNVIKVFLPSLIIKAKQTVALEKNIFASNIVLIFKNVFVIQYYLLKYFIFHILNKSKVFFLQMFCIFLKEKLLAAFVPRKSMKYFNQNY